jgi:hypothetical protein
MTRHSWVDNMKIVVKEVDWEEMDWIDQAENRDRWQAALGSM